MKNLLEMLRAATVEANLRASVSIELMGIYHRYMRRGLIEALQEAEKEGAINDFGREWLSRKLALGEFKE
jgi:hypothetical protein